MGRGCRLGYCAPLSQLKAGPSCLILHDLSRDRAAGNPCSLTSSPSFLLLQVHPAFPAWGRDTISPAWATLSGPFGHSGRRVPACSLALLASLLPSWTAPQRASQTHVGSWRPRGPAWDRVSLRDPLLSSLQGTPVTNIQWSLEVGSGVGTLSPRVPQQGLIWPAESTPHTSGDGRQRISTLSLSQVQAKRCCNKPLP